MATPSFSSNCLAAKLHRLQLREPLAQRLELASPHGAFFVNAITAFGEHVEFALVRQQFYLHAWAHRLPRSAKERLFQLGLPLGVPTS